MNRARQFPARSSAIFCVCALLLFAVAAHASDHRGAFSEEFHQTYALEADGSVELDNINGAVHISAWDQNEVKVDAVKYADSKERLDQARIEVDSGKNHISIRTKYPDHDLTFTWGSHNNPATVEYTLTVPRGARLDEIKLINGALDVEIEASTVSGGIENDFGLHVNHHSFVGHDLRGELGGGGPRIKLSNVNGRIEIRHASDGRTLSPARDSSHHDKDDDDDSEI